MRLHSVELTFNFVEDDGHTREPFKMSITDAGIKLNPSFTPPSPAQEEFGALSTLPIDPQPRASTADPEVTQLRSILFSKKLNVTEFMYLAAGMTNEQRDEFRRVIDDELNEAAYKPLTEQQRLAFAQFEDFHFRSLNGYDLIDQKYYTDTNGAD